MGGHRDREFGEKTRVTHSLSQSQAAYIQAAREEAALVCGVVVSGTAE